MDGLDHPDPIANLEQWSDNIDEFMEGLCTPLSPYLVDDPWQQPDPVEDYQQWPDDVALRVEMGLPISTF